MWTLEAFALEIVNLTGYVVDRCCFVVGTGNLFVPINFLLNSLRVQCCTSIYRGELYIHLCP